VYKEEGCCTVIATVDAAAPFIPAERLMELSVTDTKLFPEDELNLAVPPEVPPPACKVIPPPTPRTVEPPVTVMEPPAPAVLAPADKEIPPPTAVEDEPAVIEIAPAEPLLAPVERVIAPDKPAVVAAVEPEPIKSAPLSAPPARDAADVRDNAPVAAVVSD